MDAVSLLLRLFSDFSFIVGAILGSIIGLLAALIGLYWGVMKFAQHVTGPSDWVNGLSARNMKYAAQIENDNLLAMGNNVYSMPEYIKHRDA